MSLFNLHHRTSRMLLVSAALALAGGVVAAGCGGADTSTEQGFCSALAAADCSYNAVQSCYGSTDATIQTDTDSCIRARSQSSVCNPQGLTYHADFADKCIAQHSAIYSSQQIDAASWASLREACLPVFNRGGEVGTSCTDDADCDVGYQGLRCLVRVGGKGSCQAPIQVAGGASCKDPAAQCPAGNYCDTGFHCVQEGIKGDTCGAGQPCGTGYRCDAEASVCIAQLPNGSACARDADCIGGFCIGTASGTSQCAATYAFGIGTASCSGFLP